MMLHAMWICNCSEQKTLQQCMVCFSFTHWMIRHWKTRLPECGLYCVAINRQSVNFLNQVTRKCWMEIIDKDWAGSTQYISQWSYHWHGSPDRCDRWSIRLIISRWRQITAKQVINNKLHAKKTTYILIRISFKWKMEVVLDVG